MHKTMINEFSIIEEEGVFEWELRSGPFIGNPAITMCLRISVGGWMRLASGLPAFECCLQGCVEDPLLYWLKRCPCV